MEYILLEHFLIAIVSFIVAFFLVPIMSKIAIMFNILDYPDGRIKVHERSIPYLGGIAIYLSFLTTLIFLYKFNETTLWLILGLTVLLFFGLIDDLVVITPLQKFLSQFLAVFCFLKGGAAVKAEFFSTSINMTLSTFWLVLVINAFNLVDVMDGLATLLAICSSFSFLIVALILKDYALSLIILAFIFPLIAFFYYNKPSARIYLGDCGSLFIGGFLGSISLLFSWREYNYYGYIVPVVILGVPLLEVSALIIIRSLKGIPFYLGSPHHYSIYLKIKGWSKWNILTFSMISSIFLLVCAVLIFLSIIDLWLVIVTAVLFWLFWIKIIFS